MKVEEVIERLRPDHAYREAFEAVFTRPINEDDLARALASYVRTLLTGDSRYDHYINGDSGALSKLERAGTGCVSRQGQLH